MITKDKVTEISLEKWTFQVAFDNNFCEIIGRF